MFQAKVPKFPFIAKKDANASMQAHKALSDRGSGASMNVRLTPESGHSSAQSPCPLCAKSSCSLRARAIHAQAPEES